MAPKIHCPFKAPSILPPSDFSSRKLWPKRSWLTRSSCSATSIGAFVARSVLGDSHTKITWPGSYTSASSISFARLALDVSLWGWETENYGIPSSEISSLFWDGYPSEPTNWGEALAEINICWNELTTRMVSQTRECKPSWNPPKGSCIRYHSIIFV